MQANELLQQGLQYLQGQDYAAATRLLAEADLLVPNEPMVVHFLGLARCKSGDFSSGIADVRRALALQPANAMFRNNLANLLFEFGQAEEAEALYRQILLLDPLQQFAWKNLGVLLQSRGQFTEAEEAARKALSLNSGDAVANNVLGCVLRQRREFSEALSCFERAVALNPAVADHHLNLALTLSDLGRFDEALESYQAALLRNPDSVSAYTSQGLVFFIQGRMEEARASLQHGLALDPDFPKLRNNLGLLNIELGEYEQARQHYRHALQVQPEFPQVRTNLGVLELTCGNFDPGWSLYESRFDCVELALRNHGPGERWRGQSLQGKKIFVFSEQGFGDTLNFVRYLPLLVAQGAEVVFECQRPLLTLLRLNFASLPGLHLIGRGEAEPVDGDYFVSLLSLPAIFATDLQNMPALSPLQASLPARQLWQERLRHVGRPRVGVCWAGSSTHRNDRHRSIPLAAFKRVAEGVGAHFVSLRRDDADVTGKEAAAPANDSWPELTDLTRLFSDFNDTAACINELDLVVTVDTSVAHLAASLGKPVWMLTSYVPDWRWLLEREDSPWYPSLRLFRQPQRGEWESVLSEVNAALRQRYPG